MISLGLLLCRRVAECQLGIPVPDECMLSFFSPLFDQLIKAGQLLLWCSRSSCCIVSISIPRNVKVVLGPFCFSGASGMPSSLHPLLECPGISGRFPRLEDQLLRSHPNSDIRGPLPPLPPPTRAHQLNH